MGTNLLEKMSQINTDKIINSINTKKELVEEMDKAIKLGNTTEENIYFEEHMIKQADIEIGLYKQEIILLERIKERANIIINKVKCK